MLFFLRYSDHEVNQCRRFVCLLITVLPCGVQSTDYSVYSVYAIAISSVLCGDLLLQPLVAIVYIESAAVAVFIWDYLPLRRRAAAVLMAYCLNNISCCGVFFAAALSYATTCCGGRPVRGRNLWLLFTLRDLAHIARFVVYRFPCLACLFCALNLWILGGENFWLAGYRTGSYNW